LKLVELKPYRQDKYAGVRYRYQYIKQDIRVDAKPCEPERQRGRIERGYRIRHRRRHGADRHRHWPRWFDSHSRRVSGSVVSDHHQAGCRITRTIMAGTRW